MSQVINSKKRTFVNIDVFVLLIAFLSGFLVYFQSGRSFPLVDYTYQVESAYRIYSGSIPYKDFILALPPGTYYIGAFLMKFFGLNNVVQLSYIILINIFTILLTYKILNKINKDKVLNIFLTLPLIFTGHAMFPFLNYDINAMFFILIALLFLINIVEDKKNNFYFYFLGILLILPSFFKQNTGLVFFIISLCVLLLTSIFVKKEFTVKQFFWVLGGSLSVLVLFLSWLIKNNIVNDFLFQVFIYPAKCRPIIKSLYQIFLSVFKEGALLFYAAFILSFILFYKQRYFVKLKKMALEASVFITMIIVPFLVFGFRYLSHKKAQMFFWYYFSVWNLVLVVAVVFSIKAFINFKNKISLWDFFPWIFIVTILATFLSQGLLGSTYGIWPLLIILISLLIKQANQYFNVNSCRNSVKIITIVLTLVLVVYFVRNERLKFIPWKGKIEKATNSKLVGVATPGNWIPELEEMLKFVQNNISKDDKIVTVPGEDPFFYLTERQPTLFFTTMTPAVFNFDLDYFYNRCIIDGIKWIIVKTKLQHQDYINTGDLIIKIKNRYGLYKSLKAYDIYLRN